MIQTEYYNERQLIVAYILSQDLLNGTFFSSYDKANKIAELFLEKYPYTKDDWGVEEEWDETVESFVRNIDFISLKNI
jgi:hypothetical protein